MRRTTFNGLIGLCAALGLSGCAESFISTWKAPGAEPLQLRGAKVAAVVMASEPSIRLSGEDALARELTARGAVGVPMYTLIGTAQADEANARAAAGKAGIQAFVVMRPVRIDKEISSTPGAFSGPMFGVGWGPPGSMHGTEIRTDTIVVVETLLFSVAQNQLVWSGQSKSDNPGNVGRLIADTARQVADELARQGLIGSPGTAGS